MLFGDGRAQCRFLRHRIGVARAGSRGGLLHFRFGFAQPPSGGMRGVLPAGAFGSRFRRPSGGLDRTDGRADFAAAGVFRWFGAEGGQPAEVRTEEDEWYANRLVNEAFARSGPPRYGPVHINVPLSEPLFHFTVKALPSVRRMVRRDMSDEGRTLAFFLKEELPKYRRVLVVSGQMSSDEAVGVAACLSGGRVAWLTEVLGNCPSASDAVRGFDALLYAAREEDLQALRPDLVITVGGHVVSKRLKQFLSVRLRWCTGMFRRTASGGFVLCVDHGCGGFSC